MALGFFLLGLALIADFLGFVLIVTVGDHKSANTALVCFAIGAFLLWLTFVLVHHGLDIIYGVG